MKCMRLWRLVGLLTLASCGDGQAGADYRGEPLMTMSGVVTSSDMPLHEGLVPALVMSESMFDRHLVTGPVTTHYLQGTVEGTFPSAFTLRVYDAPPPQVMESFLDGEPAFALAMITAVPAGHPAWLRSERSTETREDGTLTFRDEVCSAEQCISGYSGDCATIGFDEAWPCGKRFADNRPWGTYGFAQGYLVLYLAGPAAAGSVLTSVYADGRALSAGYHVLERHEDVLDADCGHRAMQRALEEANLATGAEWTETRRSENPHDWEKYLYMAMAAENCPSGFTVRDTASAPVPLELVDQPSTRSFGF
jgi:hypothetical protein